MGRTGRPSQGKFREQEARSVAPEGFLHFTARTDGAKADIIQHMVIQPGQGAAGQTAIFPSCKCQRQSDKTARHGRQVLRKGKADGWGRHLVSPDFVLIQF